MVIYIENQLYDVVDKGVDGEGNHWLILRNCVAPLVLSSEEYKEITNGHTVNGVSLTENNKKTKNIDNQPKVSIINNKRENTDTDYRYDAVSFYIRYLEDTIIDSSFSDDYINELNELKDVLVKKDYNLPVVKRSIVMYVSYLERMKSNLFITEKTLSVINMKINKLKII